MLCRVLMERLPEKVTIIYLANPSLSRDDILYAIADELNLNVPDSARSSVVMRALHDHLIKSFGEGRQVVVLVDEAHAMPVETLEEIRLLSNLETNRNKLLQLVLFGQPELNDILARPDMRQLKERITHNFGLEPLVRDDICQYLDFRMRAAGYRGPSIFTAPALKMIEQSSLGLTRRINILADKSLLAAFSSGTHEIGSKEIRAAVRDCEFSEATYAGKATSHVRVIGIAGLLALGVLAGVAWFLAASRTEAVAPAPVVSTPSSGSGPVGPGAAVPVAATGAPPAEAAAPSGITGALPPAAPAAAAPSPPPAQLPSQPAAATVLPQAAPPAPAPADVTAAANPTPQASTAPAARTEPATAAKQEQGPKPRVGRLTRERLEAGNAWLEHLPDERWFIQILAADADYTGEIEALLRRLSSSKADMDNLRVYYSELSGRPRYGVIYGDYATREAASAAIRGLPKLLRSSKPYPRQVVRLR